VNEMKVTAAHLRRQAVIYVRQSTLFQVEHNRESTMRQYDLAARAAELGWPRPAVTVIDADLGVQRVGESRPVRVRDADRAGRARPGRHHTVAGGLPAGTQQR